MKTLGIALKPLIDIKVGDILELKVHYFAKNGQPFYTVIKNFQNVNKGSAIINEGCIRIISEDEFPEYFL